MEGPAEHSVCVVEGPMEGGADGNVPTGSPQTHRSLTSFSPSGLVANSFEKLGGEVRKGNAY